MVRDPRADIIEPSPFYGTHQKIHRVHAGQQTRSTSPINNFFRVMSQTQPTLHKGGIWHFSEEEKKHLLYATAAFTLALGFMAAGGLSGLSINGPSTWILQILLSMPIMLIAVGPAFVLHEIGHKIIAKKNGCWAEFRADPKGLQFGVLISLFLGVLFMAPGAVMVAGLVTRRQNGHIAIAGPLVNLGLFVIGIPLGAFLFMLTNAQDYSTIGYLQDGTLVWQSMVYDIVLYWIGANLILGLFNMIPLGPLDGVKVKDWNNGVWWALFLIFLSPIIIYLATPYSPMTLVIWLSNLV
jgi:Zn-dependent protease